VAALPVNNPRRILEILDSFLGRETRIVLFGRAALTMGFGEEGKKFGTTLDVDAILPTVEMSRIEADSQFWEAIDRTNKQLEPSGLYVSHLFTDRQVALTKNWLEKTVKIPSEEYRFLRLSRPDAADLILTKMMRNDPEDLKDIAFILEQEAIGPAVLEGAFKNVPALEMPELQAIFLKMQPIVLDLARVIESDRMRSGQSKTPFHSLDPDWWEKISNPTPRQMDNEKDLGLSL
jgi:hypothetical protein